MTARHKPLCLSDYARLLERLGILTERRGAGDPLINSVSCDSRHVADGTLFVCKGAAFKPAYLASAARQGACAYVSGEARDEAGIPGLVTADIRRALAAVADLFYDHPSGDLAVCGITGTKGKTTTAYYLRSVLSKRAARTGARPPALFSSIELDDGTGPEPSKLTTPESIDLQRHLARAREAGCREVVMEASSQALKYERTYDVDFAVAAFTNIGEDHISPIEHPTFEDYFASKLKIFSQARSAVVDLDMDTPAHVRRVLDAARACGRVLTYSLRDPAADVFAESLEHRGLSIRLRVRTPSWSGAVDVPTPVRFNASNALCAIACAELLGAGEKDVRAGLASAFVPGRMQVVPCADGRFAGVVDYAHNGMSLSTLLSDLREDYPDRRLVCVFGATGGKGIDRRQTMGEAAGRAADAVYATEDDPGPEDPRAICEAIATAVRMQGRDVPCVIETDRERAIRRAVRDAVADGRPAVIIATGKGHEARMLRKDGPVPCRPDAEILRDALAEAGVL